MDMFQKLQYDTGSDSGSAKVLPSPPVYTPEPLWQPFAGFSFLFRNPENSLSAFDAYQKIHIDESVLQTIALYANIAKAVSIIDPVALAGRFLFFALPS